MRKAKRLLALCGGFLALWLSSSAAWPLDDLLSWTRC